MKVLFRVLGAVAAVAATGAAILALDKLLTRKKDPLQVETVEFPDEAETDPSEAEKTAAAYAEGEAAPAEAAPEQAPAEPEAQPVTIPSTEADGPACADAPIVNPVEAGPAVAPTDENGNFDTSKIADPKDFGDWEEQGCQG